MPFLLTFCEGVITFLSPCLLPMLPIYLAYFAGGQEGATDRRIRHTMSCALGFAVGLTFVFTALGACAGTLGELLARHQRAFDVCCGAVIALLGMNYLGVLQVPPLSRTLRPGIGVIPRGFASSLLFGVVFAVGWTPCVGTFLASALALAAAGGTALRGIGLLLCYSVGLSLPFVLAAVAIDQAHGALSWARRHGRAIDRMSGVLLVLMGTLVATGWLGSWLRIA